MNNDFWFVSLIALFVIAVNAGWNIYMRVAVASNACIVLYSVIRKFIGIVSANKGGE